MLNTFIFTFYLYFFLGFKSLFCCKLRSICWALKLRNVDINSAMYLDMVMDSWKIFFVDFFLPHIEASQKS